MIMIPLPLDGTDLLCHGQKMMCMMHVPTLGALQLLGPVFSWPSRYLVTIVSNALTPPPESGAVSLWTSEFMRESSQKMDYIPMLGTVIGNCHWWWDRVSIYLCIYLSTYLPIYLSTYLPIYLSAYLSINLI